MRMKHTSSKRPTQSRQADCTCDLDEVQALHAQILRSPHEEVIADCADGYQVLRRADYGDVYTAALHQFLERYMRMYHCCGVNVPAARRIGIR